MTYELEAKPKIDTDNEDIQANAEWLHIGTTKSESAAVRLAKSKSRLNKWHEVHVVARANGDDDPVFDAYYQSGKLKQRMF